MYYHQSTGQGGSGNAASYPAQHAPMLRSSPPQAPVPLLLTGGSCMQRLQQFLNTHDASFRNQAILLIGACRTQDASDPATDLVFLLCHQIVCLAFTNTDMTPRQMWRSPNIGSTLEVLLRIMVLFPRDSAAGKNYLKYFSDFPAPLLMSSQWSQSQTLMGEVLQFIHRFCESHDGFQQTCIALQRLPLPENIIAFFSVTSPGLQKVVYRW